MLEFGLGFAWRDLRSSGRALRVFCACLALGVCLIAATGGLYRQVSAGLLGDARSLFGADIEVRDRAPLRTEELEWITARGEVSLTIELRTMMITAGGGLQLVQLLSVDEGYPLYGALRLQPPTSIRAATERREGNWGVAIDPLLGERLGLGLGDEVGLGSVTATVRALIERQPDRSLRADWRGPPVLVAAEMLPETGLVQPGSRLAYRYRVKTEQAPDAWRDAFTAAFPSADWEVRTLSERRARLSKALAQVASGLLLVGFSALFIGGLGVSNSVHAYLQGKLTTLATLQALGLRPRALAGVYLGQILMLAAAASLAGAVAGAGLALAGTALGSARIAVAFPVGGLVEPAAAAWLFGMLTALVFSLPPLGRALSVQHAVLFRAIGGLRARPARGYRWLTAAGAALAAAVALAVIPDLAFGVGFALATVLVLGLLEALVRVLRLTARLLLGQHRATRRFALHLALANLCRPDSALRASLLSLGTALTLLVASALVVSAVLRALDETIPEQAPALVFYDISADQLESIRASVSEARSLERLDLAPLVLGRLGRVNDEVLRESTRSARVNEAHDEHKMSYRLENFDQVIVERGEWWPQRYRGPALVAMEDYEADQLGLRVGDRLRFEIGGRHVEADLVAIYSQRRLRTRFWLEAIFSDGVLDPFITRYVGAAYLDPGEAAKVQNRVGAIAPNVVTVRTERLLEEARTLLARAGAGVAAIATVSLAVSLLVLVSVVAASRVRHAYDATVLFTLGARDRVIRRALLLEYSLLAFLTSVFAVIAGSTIAVALLDYRLELEVEISWWLGVATAVGVSGTSLALGAWYLLGQLRLSPALLLRTVG